MLTRAGEFELRILRDHVPRDRLAIDAGANLGIYSYHLSRHARSVMAFEANPAFESVLELLPKRVAVHYAALSSSAGRLLLSIPAGVDGEALGWATLESTEMDIARQIEVPVHRLDDFDLPPVGFIKVDVEGHEMEVLRGAEAIVARDRPALLVESEETHRPGVLTELFAWTAERNYEGWFYQDGKRQPLSEFRAEVHQANKSLLPGQRVPRQDMAYVNNFLFIPR